MLLVGRSSSEQSFFSGQEPISSHFCCGLFTHDHSRGRYLNRTQVPLSLESDSFITMGFNTGAIQGLSRLSLDWQSRLA